MDKFKVKVGNLQVTATWDVSGKDLKPGDLYIGCRDSGWEIAQCKKVEPVINMVIPDPPCAIYHYDMEECFKVLEVQPC